MKKTFTVLASVIMFFVFSTFSNAEPNDKSDRVQYAIEKSMEAKADGVSDRNAGISKETIMDEIFSYTAVSNTFTYRIIKYTIDEIMSKLRAEIRLEEIEELRNSLKNYKIK